MAMRAKVKSTQQVIGVECVDLETSPETATWMNTVNGDRYLASELDFEDLTDYRAFTEKLVHDLAVAGYPYALTDENDRKKFANEVVLTAFAITDRLMQENKTWR